MIFLSAFKEESVYEALRAGRLYIRYYSKDKREILLDDFHIADSLADSLDESAFIAGEITIKKKPRLFIRGSLLISPSEELRIEVIRNGSIVKEFRLAGPRAVVGLPIAQAAGHPAVGGAIARRRPEGV